MGDFVNLVPSVSEHVRGQGMLGFRGFGTNSRLTGCGTDYRLVFTGKTSDTFRCCNLSVRPDGP